jgi:hypothetical protein
MSQSGETTPRRVPIPAEKRWQWVRVQVAPVIVFGAVILAMVALWNAYVAVPVVPLSVEPAQASSPQPSETEANRSVLLDAARAGSPPIRTVPSNSAPGSGEVAMDAEQRARAATTQPTSVQ